MSLSNLKPVACRIPPVTGANGSHSKVSKVKMVNKQAPPPLQVKEMEKSLPHESFASRRDMVQLTAASVGLLSLLLPASAEARPRNATMRQKIMEKLQQLREKAGFSKSKDEGEEERKPKVEEQDKKLKVKNGTEEKKPMPKDGEVKKPNNEETFVPALPNILNGKTVETTLP
ncbi:hypothetical protein BUALT_Bualt05G0113200 [Buddleja alternifolia]|uniref:Uncharacterized protein n=1 Tax=Buddleja alternifolia TaxID=168488 RepID=A0AAV6XKD0_9LAMI|nr:hypothetical protein BUALT_Bualt05G0113200 [Buddleja alternifolia]